MDKTFDYINIMELLKMMKDEYKKEMKNIGHVNIIIAGKTGVGKSTLINATFRDNLAETGMGKPVTAHLKKYEKDGVPIRIYDTVGLELDEERQQQSIKEICDIIKEKTELGLEHEDEFIHCVWYCIQADSDRIEEAEQKFIRTLSNECDVPVILVITKAYLKKHAREFADEIKKFNLPVKAICCVLAQSYEDDDVTFKPYGVQELVEITFDLLPESAKRAFANAQKASLKIKFDESIKIIEKSVAAAFTAGFAPIPVADAAVLIPIQITMFARITNVYGIKMTQELILALVKAMLGIAGATFAGRAVVANLLKLIPGVGTVLGGTISGGTASIFTWGLGRTYIELMERIFKGEINVDDLDNDDMKKEIEKVLKENLKKEAE